MRLILSMIETMSGSGPLGADAQASCVRREWRFRGLSRLCADSRLKGRRRTWLGQPAHADALPALSSAVPAGVRHRRQEGPKTACCFLQVAQRVSPGQCAFALSGTFDDMTVRMAALWCLGVASLFSRNAEHNAVRQSFVRTRPAAAVRSRRTFSIRINFTIFWSGGCC